jgi:hypothetical protein
MLIWLWAVVAFLFLVDALRVRGRIAQVPVLAPSDEPASPEHRFLVAPGVVLDDATRRAASAHARKAKLSVLDLVPHDLPALEAWGFFQFLDPEKYRKDTLGKMLSAGHAVLVTADVLARAQLRETAPSDQVAFVRAAGRLKWYASTSTDLAIAKGLRAVKTERRLAVLRERHGGGADFVLVGVPLILAIIAVAAITGSWPGLSVLAVFQLQPLLAFAGGPLRPRWLLPVVLLRYLIDVVGWAGLVLEDAPSVDPKEVEARRPEYEKLVADGLDRFFEPRRDTCPLCGDRSLKPAVRVTDILQHKPGRFTLERCGACGHLFQNPRLSIEGLGYYYKDFYDGLGGDDLEAIFGASWLQYIQRADFVRSATEPKKWLDVGGGHGHFCRSARDRMPDVRFDALDLSESIEDAERRGWVDRGYRGLFPDMAAQLAGQYDVVTMSHYLEHTRDPEAEIAAAQTTLSDGGVLMIEVPDPECPFAKLFGRLWLPYFQPQHQHLLSTKNLEKLLSRHGFGDLVWARGPAHQPVDFLAALILFLNWIAPKGDVPWRPRSAAARAWRAFCYVAASPGLVVARAMDALLEPLVTRLDWSNTYRVLARKKT